MPLSCTLGPFLDLLPHCRRVSSSVTFANVSGSIRLSSRCQFSGFNMEPRRPVPPGLQGKEWLYLQGCRAESARTSPGAKNPEFDNDMLLTGARTRVRPDESNAQDWQLGYAQSRRDTMQCADFDPGRMVQYVEGRPCVAPKRITPLPLVHQASLMMAACNVPAALGTASF